MAARVTPARVTQPTALPGWCSCPLEEKGQKVVAGQSWGHLLSRWLWHLWLC